MEKIYLQSYSFDDYDPANNEKNFRLAAQMGFDGIELFGPNFEMEPDKVKAIMDECGMEVISLHANADKIIETIPYAKAVGSKFIGIGMQYLPDKEAVYAFTSQLDEIGKVCRENGLTLTYHNHTQEFLKYDGKTILEILLENTEPAHLSLEMDAGWVAASGTDPLEFLAVNGERVKLVHIKECDEAIGIMSQFNPADMIVDDNGVHLSEAQEAEMAKMDATNCPAGKGLVDWAKLVPFAESKGCQGFIVEREATYAGERIDCLKADIEYSSSVL